MPGQKRQPVVIRRNSWRSGVAEVVGLELPPSEWPDDKAPYYGNPKVFVLVKYGSGSPYALEELSCAGTYGYRQLDGLPSWWRGGIRYPVAGYWKRRKLELLADGSFVLHPGPPEQARLAV